MGQGVGQSVPAECGKSLQMLGNHGNDNDLPRLATREDACLRQQGFAFSEFEYGE